MRHRTRYTINDVNNNRFYQMSKFLFEGEFKNLSNDARILYSLLRDRHQLSITNGWINRQNEVFLIFTREDMAELLGCSQPTLRKAIKQLTETRLMEEERQGANKPNLIYLTAINIELNEPENLKKTKKMQVKNSKEKIKVSEGNLNKREKDNFKVECKNFSPQKGSEKDLHSGVKKSFIQECKILSPNKTDINNTDISDTDKSVCQSAYEYDNNADYNKINKKTEKQDRFKEQLEYLDKTLKRCETHLIEDSYRDTVIHAIRLLVMDIENKKIIRIGENLIPTKLVRNDLEKLNFLTIEHAVRKFKEAASIKKIRNTVAYLKSCIYNSIHEVGVGVDSELRYLGLI